jgi:hypothetical protein
MKKTWIKIKRGLLEPKHRVRLGIRVWLYLYMLDIVDWETGKIIEWKDKSASDELQLDLNTLREQRKKLEDDKYISCKQKYHRMEISIINWTNPREYSGEVYNEMVVENNDHVVVNGLNDGSNDGLNDGLNDGFKTPYKKPVPSYNHKPHNTPTHNRIYTKRKSYDEVIQEKAADYTRYRKSKFVHQGAE